MQYGFGAALTWAFDTVILGIALSNVVFLDTPTAIALASFTSTFLHDGMSAIYMFIYMAVRKKLKKTWQLLTSPKGKFIVLAALIGGPFGMSGYVLAIDNIGPAYTAAISAFFPAFGSLLSVFFLKHKMKWYQWIGLFVCLAAVAMLGWTPAEGVPGNWTLGIVGALVTVVGWGTEAVIIEWALRDATADDECCLQIRQTTSAVTYALVLLPLSVSVVAAALELLALPSDLPDAAPLAPSSALGVSGWLGCVEPPPLASCSAEYWYERMATMGLEGVPSA